MENKRFTFEEIFAQNERRIYFHMHRLNLKDPHQEYYQKGLIAMWEAYQKYQPDKGAFSTYFNAMINQRLRDLMREKYRTKEKETLYQDNNKALKHNGNYQQGQGTATLLVPHTEIPVEDDTFWQQVKSRLSNKQWKWVQFFIIEGMSIKEIAQQENVSQEAVKDWGKEAKKKLRNVLISYFKLKIFPKKIKLSSQTSDISNRNHKNARCIA